MKVVFYELKVIRLLIIWLLKIKLIILLQPISCFGFDIPFLPYFKKPNQVLTNDTNVSLRKVKTKGIKRNQA